MSIQVKCLLCGVQNSVTEARTAKRIRCQGCGESIRIAPDATIPNRPGLAEHSASGESTNPLLPQRDDRKNLGRWRFMGFIGMAGIVSLLFIDWFGIGSRDIDQQPSEELAANSVELPEQFPSDEPGLTTVSSNDRSVQRSPVGREYPSTSDNATSPTVAAGSSSELMTPALQVSWPEGTQSSAGVNASANAVQRQKIDSPTSGDVAETNERGKPPQLPVVLTPAPTSAAPGDLSDVNWAADGKPALERMLQKMKPKSAQDDFRVRCDALLAEVERFQNSGTEKDLRAAVLLVGVLRLPSAKIRLDQIVTDVFVDSLGHFVAAVQPGRPVGFRLHGFLPVDYTPKGSMDGVEFAGELAFKKTPPNLSATITGKVRLEGTQPQGILSVDISVLPDNINRIIPAQNSRRYDHTRIEPQIDYHGDSFRVTGLSPIRYQISVFYPRYRVETIAVKLSPRQSLNLGTVVLREIPSPQIKAAK